MFRRGEVYLVDLNMLNDDGAHAQKGARPVVVISNDKNNEHSSLIHYVPLTSELKATHLPVHIIINNRRVLQTTSMALCEQVDRVSQEEFLNMRIERWGKLPEEDMQRICEGIAVQFGFQFMLNSVTHKKVIGQ